MKIRDLFNKKHVVVLNEDRQVTFLYSTTNNSEDLLKRAEKKVNQFYTNRSIVVAK
jgi:hypothetical protein